MFCLENPDSVQGEVFSIRAIEVGEKFACIQDAIGMSTVGPLQ